MGYEDHAGLMVPKPLAKIRRLGDPAKTRGAGSMGSKTRGGKEVPGMVAD